MQPLTRSRPRPRFFGTSGPSFALDFVNGTNALDPRVTFTRASSATYFDSAGVLQSAANDVPRFDYNPATLAARGLLIEESRTNLCLQSEAFNTLANWSANNSSITANAVNSPAATLTADQITEDIATGFHGVSQLGISYTSGTAYTFSVFAKANSRSIVQITPGSTAFSAVPYANFNLSTGVVSATGGGASATIQNCGNGWYRCTMTATANATISSSIFLGLQTSGTAVRLQTYLGDGASNLYLWGAQVEAGAFPTSVIPTTTTALTRAADVASVTTLSPWYNASEGTLYWEGSGLDAFGRTMLSISDGTTAERIRMVWSTSVAKAINTEIVDGNVFQGSVPSSIGSIVTGQVYKLSFGYKTNDLAGSRDGGAVGTDTTATIPSVTTMHIGAGPTGGFEFLCGHIRRITYYPRRLSNTELQAITA